MTNGSEIPQDLRRMLADVCVEYNVRIDSDDPAVAIVTLNRLVLEAALTRAVEQIRTATADLELQLQNVQVRAGALLAQEMRAAIKNVASAFNKDPSPAILQSRPKSPMYSMLFGSLTFGAVFGAGVWVGTLIR
jgi:hypothetical protein